MPTGFSEDAVVEPALTGSASGACTDMYPASRPGIQAEMKPKPKPGLVLVHQRSLPVIPGEVFRQRGCAAGPGNQSADRPETSREALHRLQHFGTSSDTSGHYSPIARYESSVEGR